MKLFITAYSGMVFLQQGKESVIFNAEETYQQAMVNLLQVIANR
jgi:hypothetical protein